jgi:hypothetical protein
MTEQKELHALTIKLRDIGEQKALEFEAVGTLTQQDYEQVATKAELLLDEVRDSSVLALVDATAFSGWEPGAAFEDFKLGMRHNKKFKRVAIVISKDWQEWLSKLSNWFTTAEVRDFKDRDSAIVWLSES